MTATVIITAAHDPAAHPPLQTRAEALAQQLGLPMTGDADVQLRLTPEGLEAVVLRGDDVLVGAKPFHLDLTRIDTTTGPGRSLQSPLFKAVGIRKGNPHRPAILDATAGFGEDAWLLAAAGCRVTACENNPAMFALLQDALDRARQTHPDIASRIAVQHADSIPWLSQSKIQNPKSEIVYLDPMFPAQRKTAQRKPMRLARLLVGEGGGEAALLEAARNSAAKRIVVKRPRHAPFLGGLKPVASHEGRALRFDVYVERRNDE